MRLIAVMISRMIFVRFFSILLGLSFFLLSLEVVAYAREVTAIDGGALTSVVKYMAMRAPQVLSTYLAMSLLLAVLLTITELSYRNELTAIWSAGISPFLLIAMLAPAALLAGTLHVLLIDRGVPAAAPVLREWAIGDYGQKKLKLGEKDPIWLRSGTDILRAASASADSRLLHDVIIFRRDAQGLLTRQVFAETAERREGQWHLTNVTTYFRENKPPERLDQAIYKGNLRAAAAGSRSGDPEEMTFGDLSYFIANKGFGIRPTYVYETWRHKRITPFFVSLVMVALCVPLAARYRRGGGMGMLFALGVGMGFGFFVFDGLSMSVGELGFVPPWMAAWTPLLVFALLALFLNLRAERV